MLQSFDEAPAAPRDPQRPEPSGVRARFDLQKARRLRRALLAASLGIFSMALWGSSVGPHQMLLGRDTLGLYLSLKTFMAQAFRAGHLPAWYPYDGLGFSIPGGLVAGLLDPSNLLLLFLKPANALKWQVLICYPLAAAGGYYLGRSLRLPTIAACAVGAAFAGSGYLMSQSANLLYIEGASRLPWVLAAAENIARRDRRRDIGIFALAMASVLWAGDVETLLILVPITAFIVALRAKTSRKKWAHWIFGGVLALALNAPVVGSAIETYGGSTRRKPLDASEALSWSLSPLRIPELAIGSPFHFHLGLGAIALRFGGQNLAFWSESVFLGSAVVALAIFGFGGRRKKVGLYLGIGALGLWLALGGAGHLYAHVPGLMYFRYPEKFAMWVSLAAAVGAGAGIAKLARGPLSGKLLSTLIAGVLAVGFFLGLWIPGYRTRAGWSALALALLGLAAWRLGRARWRQLAALAVLSGELAVCNHSLIHAGDMRGFATQPLPIPGLQAGDRICSDLAVGSFLHSDHSVDAKAYTRWQIDGASLDFSGRLGLRSVVALVPALPRELERLCSVVSVCADVCARMMGARWRIVPLEDAKALVASGQFKQVANWAEPKLAALRDLQGPPYASMRPARLYTDPWPLEIALHDKKIPVDRYAFLRRGMLPDANLFSGRGEVKTLVRAPGMLTLRTKAAAPSILAVREAFAAGWHATIDGRMSQVIPVDLGMIGLPIAAGSHTVQLEYRPWGWPWIWGLYGLGLFALGWQFARRQKTRRPT